MSSEEWESVYSEQRSPEIEWGYEESNFGPQHYQVIRAVAQCDQVFSQLGK
jgi:hypothetical protein